MLYYSTSVVILIIIQNMLMIKNKISIPDGSGPGLIRTASGLANRVLVETVPLLAEDKGRRWGGCRVNSVVEEIVGTLNVEKVHRCSE